MKVPLTGATGPVTDVGIAGEAAAEGRRETVRWRRDTGQVPA